MPWFRGQDIQVEAQAWHCAMPSTLDSNPYVHLYFLPLSSFLMYMRRLSVYTSGRLREVSAKRRFSELFFFGHFLLCCFYLPLLFSCFSFRYTLRSMRDRYGAGKFFFFGAFNAARDVGFFRVRPSSSSSSQSPGRWARRRWDGRKGYDEAVTSYARCGRMLMRDHRGGGRGWDGVLGEAQQLYDVYKHLQDYTPTKERHHF